MNNQERREARYQRRLEKRAVKKMEQTGRIDFESVFSYENLYKSYKKCRRGVSWKASVQKFITNAPLEVYRIHTALMEGTWKSKGFFEFDIFERGKARHIRSVTIDERVVQRCLCDYCLTPALSRTFIYDNGATMKDKGYHFSIDRCEKHLHDHYRKYGNEGYVLVFDFHKFFDNVDHAVIKKALRECVDDPRLISLTEYFIDAFGEKGLGLGSQISQLFALASGNRLDHYCKEILRIHGYGRYMDDGYLIHPSKEYLKKCLEGIRKICAELGIELNENKVQIIKLSHGFTYLKCRFYLTESGRVIRKIYKRSVTKARRKLRKLKSRFDNHELSAEDIYQSFQSWRAYARHFDSWHTVENMNKLYRDLYCPVF